ncbi:ABC transporter periplasmic-binding protein [mine drainage metagenome]|uniref:ABC transporter periplasmic-binding protein n=1 Tax=mine drainage metagenome TaxID=410659 RepID=T1C1T3_9ZZZZ
MAAVLVLTVVLVAAAYGVVQYESLRAPSGPTLTIWTYPSFFDSGLHPNRTLATIVGGFENLTGSTVVLEYPTGDLASALLSARPGTLPDVVLGLDEITAGQVEKAGLLFPYTPPNLVSVNATLAGALGPPGEVTPYEFGYLGLDYGRNFNNASGRPFGGGDFFTNLSAQPALASQFIYEDPVAGSIVGEEFLAWQVEFYTHVLHENWTGFWTGLLSHCPSSCPVTAPDWTDAFNAFSSGQGQSLVSYTTDTAYNAYFRYGGAVNSTVAFVGGHAYGWETVYGAGILRSSPRIPLAERFVNWMLSGTVQSLVATNEWEYPANQTALADLPSVYSLALSPSEITPLDPYLPPLQASQEISQWILELVALGV